MMDIKNSSGLERVNISSMSQTLLPPIIGTAKKKQVHLNTPKGSIQTNSNQLPAIDERKQYEIKVPVYVRKPSNYKRECNFYETINSLESIMSPIPDHWREQHHRVSRDRPSQSEVQQQNWEKPGADERDSIDEDETEGLLPRTFFPLGVDWDSRLEVLNYGTDVTVKSSSSSSSDSNAPISTPTDHEALADWFLFSKKTAASVLNQGSVAFEGYKKKVIMKSEPPRLIFGDHEKEKDVKLVAIKCAQKRQARKNRTQEVLKGHYDLMNLTVEIDGPRDESGGWTTKEPVAHHIMRRTTLEIFKGREVIHNLIRRSCLRRQITFESYVEQLHALKAELDSIDSVGRVALTNQVMTNFCYYNDNGTTDLLLHGRPVEHNLGRRLYDFDLVYLFLFLLDNPNIVYLDFSYNNLTSLGVCLLGDYLSWDKNITGLNLMNNDINSLDSYIIDSFEENHTLKSLRLNGNPIKKQGGEYLAFMIMFKDLEHLDMGQTDQTIQSLAWIAQVANQTKSLKVLDLSRILGYPGYINDSLHYAIAFSDILRLNSSLVELHIQKNNISDSDVEQIIFGLSFNRTLELLDLSCNTIGDPGAEIMATSLKRGAPLKALMLARNRIGNQGARAFSFHLPESHIQFLDLSHNKIQDTGIIDIVTALRKPCELFALFIFGNPFKTRALRLIGHHISKGILKAESLDIVLYYSFGELDHARNADADRYATRYYRSYGNDPHHSINKLKRNRDMVLPCLPGGASYKHHNVFNPRRHSKIVLPSINRNRQACPM